MSVKIFAAIAIASAVVLSAHPAGGGEGSRVDVVVVRGNLDARLASFVIDSIERSDADIVVVQMDVGAVLHDRIEDLVALITDPPVPIAVWVGPAPGSARGGAAAVLAAAQIRGAAPGTTVGLASPMVAGAGDDPARIRAMVPEFPDAALHAVIEVGDDEIPGLVDVALPAIGQFIVWLHGTEVEVAGDVVTLDTARLDVVDGVETLTPAGRVRFIEPGLVDRILSVGTQPEATLLLLLLGLSLAVLEFYAVGPGVAAVAAAALLLLAGHGMVVLPVWWPAIAALVAGVALHVMDFQRNDLSWRTVVGTALLVFGGLRFVTPSEQLATTPWVVLLVVAGVVAFFLVALTTVARARFATQTIGREHLVGRAGVAEGRIGPDGYVSVDGARWRARATRASGIRSGDPVTVTAVDGIVLEVEPREEPRGGPRTADREPRTDSTGNGKRGTGDSVTQ